MPASTHDLTQGPVTSTLARLAMPMVLGIAAVVLFNVVDTFWIGRLGADALAAISFTLPVSFVVMNVTMGLGVGATSVIARAIGNGDPARVRRLTTHALILANVVVLGVALLGLATIDPLFRALGASEALLPLIRQYMEPWYLGVGFLVIPMVGNSAIRATGDTRTPSLVMILAGGVNVVLDPVLIFGWGSIPALGMQGAAFASVLSWIGAFGTALYILGRRLRLLEGRRPRLAELWVSWREILYIGVPAAGTQLLVPVSTGILTRMVAAYGETAVAAFGVANRLESLAMITLFALSSAIAPFAAQNYGARRTDRVRVALRTAVKFALAWGALAAVVLAALASTLGGLFNEDPRVVETIAFYLVTVPISYGLLGSALVANSIFNAVNKPMWSAFLVVVRLLVLAVPLAVLGSYLFGLRGLFAGICVGNTVVGLLAAGLVRRFLITTAATEQIAASLNSSPGELVAETVFVAD